MRERDEAARWRGGNREGSGGRGVCQAAAATAAATAADIAAAAGAEEGAGGLVLRPSHSHRSKIGRKREKYFPCGPVFPLI